MKTTYRTAARRQLVELFSARPDRHFTAEQVCAYIDYIIRHNPRDFVNVPFIGNETPMLC